MTVDIAEGDASVGSLFLKEGKDGVYKVIFNKETLKINIDYIKEIDTPRYDYLTHCDVSIIRGGYKTMTVNPKNQDELMAEGIVVPMYASVVFCERPFSTSKYSIYSAKICTLMVNII